MATKRQKAISRAEEAEKSFLTGKKRILAITIYSIVCTILPLLNIEATTVATIVKVLGAVVGTFVGVDSLKELKK